MAQKLRPQAETLSGLPQPNFTAFTPSPVIAKRNPTTSDTGYPLGQNWVNTVSQAAYELVGVAAGSATWVGVGGGEAGVETINSLSPSGGNINIAGTANQVAASNAGSTVTLSLTGPYTPATFAADGVLYGNGTSSIGSTAVGTAGQVLTSNGVGLAPTFQNAASGGLAYNPVPGTTQAMAVNNGYYCLNSGLTTLTLPSTAVAGSVIQVQGLGAGGWTIAQNAGQSIKFLAATSTLGAGGSVSSIDPQGGVTLLCVTANTTFIVISSIGNVTVN